MGEADLHAKILKPYYEKHGDRNSLLHSLKSYFLPEVARNCEHLADEIGEEFDSDKFDSCDIDVRMEPLASDEVEPEILYHVTPTRFIKRVFKQGLRPMSGSKLTNHPPRIYLATDLSSAKAILNSFRRYEESLWKSNPEVAKKQKIPKKGTFGILTVDLNALPSSTSFHQDPEFGGGVYTYDPIPASALGLRVVY